MDYPYQEIQMLWNFQVQDGDFGCGSKRHPMSESCPTCGGPCAREIVVSGISRLVSLVQGEVVEGTAYFIEDSKPRLWEFTEDAPLIGDDLSAVLVIQKEEAMFRERTGR